MLKFHSTSRFAGVLWAVLTFFGFEFVKYRPDVSAASGEPAKNTDVAAPFSGESENGSAA